MVDRTRIEEHQDVRGSDGGHVGTVDHLDGDRIKLTKTDPAAGGEHHFIHLDSVDRVEAGAVILNRTTAQARDEWGVEAVGSAPDETDEHGAQPGSATAGP
ncbi:DUF2171 domain-containing protein [Aureimonas sp. Leaf324]|jgi:hypothetical protein|uniref:DUF2171 domain-containing protein n=1 Tax=Aureimonas sp. Leaf324 TaxID=1736336 RepID=UPI0009E84A4D|nr:DUF2171 domain-containing protein [Aureimonas sp. Leaf324]